MHAYHLEAIPDQQELVYGMFNVEERTLSHVSTSIRSWVTEREKSHRFTPKSWMNRGRGSETSVVPILRVYYAWPHAGYINRNTCAISRCWGRAMNGGGTSFTRCIARSRAGLSPDNRNRAFTKSPISSHRKIAETPNKAHRKTEGLALLMSAKSFRSHARFVRYRRSSKAEFSRDRKVPQIIS